MQLERYKGNPVLGPNPDNDWEDLIVTNPGAWYEESEGKVYMLYRAAGKDPRHIVHLGLAVSDNGYDFRRVSDKPALSPLPGTIEGGVIEDPRVVKFGQWYYVTYAVRPFYSGFYWVHGKDKDYNFVPLEDSENLPEPLVSNGMVTCLAVTRDFKSWVRLGQMNDPRTQDHDVIIFPEKIGGKYAILHRPFSGSVGDNAPGMWLAMTDHPMDLSNTRPLLMPKLDWEGIKIGGNTPPIKTKHGWLVLYHGVGLDRFYRLGALLLDLNDPYRILHKTAEAILEPSEPYEMKGCHNYKGVVFPCGNVVIDGRLIVYYGAADKYVGIASCPIDELVEYLMKRGQEPFSKRGQEPFSCCCGEQAIDIEGREKVPDPLSPLSSSGLSR